MEFKQCPIYLASTLIHKTFAAGVQHFPTVLYKLHESDWSYILPFIKKYSFFKALISHYLTSLFAKKRLD